jgi:imidazolonepropionase-like amidohydrolase
MGNARILGLDDYVGSVEQGKSADLIVVRDNPLDDLAVLRNVEMVMTRGRLIRDPHVRRMREIDQLLDRYM